MTKAPQTPHEAKQMAALVTRLSAYNRGRDNGISGHALALCLGLPERLVRKLISQARLEGTAIVGTPETGYYIAQTAEELNECCEFLRHRAMHSLGLEAKLRGIALPELLGQLHLPT